MGVGCGLGRVEVVAFGCDGTSVACALLVVGWVPLGVLSLASGLSHPATIKPAVPNMPARNVRRFGLLRPPSMSSPR
jgi:hypothetical protein